MSHTPSDHMLGATVVQLLWTVVEHTSKVMTVHRQLIQMPSEIAATSMCVHQRVTRQEHPMY